MPTCNQCGTHLWVGTEDCPTCDPVPAGAAARRPEPTVAQGPAAPAVPPVPDHPADDRRPLAVALLVACLPVGAGALFCSRQVEQANQRGDRVASHTWSRRMLRTAAAAPALWLLILALPVLVGSGQRAPGGLRTTTGQADSPIPTFPLLSDELVDADLDRNRANCVAAAVLADLTAEDWQSVTADGMPPELAVRVHDLAGGC